jgi:hypothetical protein
MSKSVAEIKICPKWVRAQNKTQPKGFLRLHKGRWIDITEFKPIAHGNPIAHGDNIL